MSGNKLTLIGLVTGICIVALLTVYYGYEATWKLWDIPVMNPYFADARVITSGAASHALGYDPLVSNPCDLWGRQMNYPRIWQFLFKLGIDQGSTLLLGSLLILLFVVGFLISLPRVMDCRTALMLLSALFSPAILLAVERGNNDLFIFFLVSSAIALANLRVAGSYVASLLVLIVAYMLKIFPIFGLLLFVENGLKHLRAFAVAFVVAITYAALNAKEFAQISRVTEKSAFLSYGMNVIPFFVAKHVEPASLGRVREVMTLMALFTLLALYCGLKTSALNGSSQSGDYREQLDALRVGAGIYIGTFIFAGNNWDYRLMFLLLVIPQLAAFSREKDRLIAGIATVCLANIMFSLWYLKISSWMNYNAASFYFDEVNNWSLLYGLSFLLTYSMPDSIKRYFSKPAFSGMAN